jgi:hypothetical protein
LKGANASFVETRTSTTAFESNGVLAPLSTIDQGLLQDQLSPVDLPYRTPLESAFRKIDYVYFLQCGIASVVAIRKSIASVVAISKHRRGQAEAGLTGFEGMTGLAIILGTDRSPCSDPMQIGGRALRIRADELRSAVVRCSTLRDALSRMRVFHKARARTTLTTSDTLTAHRSS